MMLDVILQGVPPSTNKAYVTGQGGRRVLGVEGKAYKTGVTTDLVRYHPGSIQGFKKDIPYVLAITLYMDIFNSGWPKKAKTRYKKLDASNRVKLLEDALVTALDIDDSQFTSVTVVKQHSTDPPRTRIVVFEDDDPE